MNHMDGTLMMMKLDSWMKSTMYTQFNHMDDDIQWTLSHPYCKMPCGTFSSSTLSISLKLSFFIHEVSLHTCVISFCCRFHERRFINVVLFISVINFICTCQFHQLWCNWSFLKKIQNQPLFSLVKVSTFSLKICLWARVKTNFNSFLDFYFRPFLPPVK
jgi:hypothetical protein